MNIFISQCSWCSIQQDKNLIKIKAPSTILIFQTSFLIWCDYPYVWWGFLAKMIDSNKVPTNTYSKANDGTTSSTSLLWLGKSK